MLPLSTVAAGWRSGLVSTRRRGGSCVSKGPAPSHRALRPGQLRVLRDVGLRDERGRVAQRPLPHHPPPAASVRGAWDRLEFWEDTADDELGSGLGDLVIRLWCVHRFGDLPEVEEFITQQARDGTHGGQDPLLDDIVRVSFALGASWVESRRQT